VGIDAVEGLPEGVDGAPVETVACGDLAALVSRLPEQEVRMRRRDLRRHLNVIERAFAATTVIPCPFGTMVDDAETLREVLATRAQELWSTLERLRGRAQLNVKAEYDEEAVLRDVVREHPTIQRLRDETRRLGDAGHFARIRLGELVAEGIRERRAHDAARVEAQLRQVSEGLVAEQSRDELTVLKGAFLVQDVARFDRVLDELAGNDAGLILYESIGPLPPTAFADEAAAFGG
jgi:gas vesicle protein GvpL/GvpF